MSIYNERSYLLSGLAAICLVLGQVGALSGQAVAQEKVDEPQASVNPEEVCEDTGHWDAQLDDFVERMNDGGFSFTELHLPERPDRFSDPDSEFNRELEKELQNKVAPWIRIAYPWSDGRVYTDAEQAVVGGHSYLDDIDGDGSKEELRFNTISKAIEAYEKYLGKTGEHPTDVSCLLTVIYPPERAKDTPQKARDWGMRPFYNPITEDITDIQIESADEAGPGDFFIKRLSRKQAEQHEQISPSSGTPTPEGFPEMDESKSREWYYRIYGGEELLHVGWIESGPVKGDWSLPEDKLPAGVDLERAN